MATKTSSTGSANTKKRTAAEVIHLWRVQMTPAVPMPPIPGRSAAGKPGMLAASYAARLAGMAREGLAELEAELVRRGVTS